MPAPTKSNFAAGIFDRTVCLLTVLCLGLCAEFTVAADPPKSRRAAVDLSEVDEDFPFQGEYYGQLTVGERAPLQAIGLQVVAQGNGQFFAVEYPGGLPGFGWYGGPKLKLHGSRDGEQLVLNGLGRRYIVENGSASVADDSNATHGSIPKVERISRTLGKLPPPGGRILFGGFDTNDWVNAKVTPDGLLEQGASTKDVFGDYFLHVEFQLSYMPFGRGQGRSNSGIYLQSRYEVQILDSFGLEGAFNECGSLYRSRRADLNMCLPPLVWQTYDIDFNSPRFDAAGRKAADARLTVWQNGFPVQYMIDIPTKTGHGKAETPQFLPIMLQSHGNPVRFRNIWILERPWTDYIYRSIFPPGQSWDAVSVEARRAQHRDYWYW